MEPTESTALCPPLDLSSGRFPTGRGTRALRRCGSNRECAWDCCGHVTRGQRRNIHASFWQGSLAHGDLQPRILFSANIQTLPLDAELQPPAAMASCGGSSCGDSNNGGTAWSVHDGQFFANHVHNSSPAVPNEHRFMMLPADRRDEHAIIHLRDLKVSLERLEGSGPPNDSPSLRRAASAAVRHEPSIQRRWSVHDGLFFARHCRLNAPSTMNERLWLLRIGELPRGTFEVAAAKAAAPTAAPAAVAVDAEVSEVVDVTEASSPQPRGLRGLVAEPPAASPPTAAAVAAAAVAAATEETARPPMVQVGRSLGSPATREPAARGPRDVSDSGVADEGSLSVVAGDDRCLPEAVFLAACRPSGVMTVRAWLFAGGDINAREAGRGWTLLMTAAVCDNNLLVLELLQRGASTEVEQHMGSTALALAAMQGSYQACVLLVNAGATINSVDQMGVTPFMSAAIKGHKAVAELLLRNGAKTLARVDEHVTRVKRIDEVPAEEKCNTSTCNASTSGPSGPTGSTCSTGSANRRSHEGGSGGGGGALSPSALSPQAGMMQGAGGMWAVQRCRLRSDRHSSSSVSIHSGCSSHGDDYRVRPKAEEEAEARARELVAEEEAEARARGLMQERDVATGGRRSRKNKTARAKTR